MSKALLLVRVEEREQFGQGQAHPRTQGSDILGRTTHHAGYREKAVVSPSL